MFKAPPYNSLGCGGEGDPTSVDNAGTPNAPHVVLNSVYNAQGRRTSLAATVNGCADFINSYCYDALSRLNQIDQQSQSGGNAVAPKSIYVGYDGVGDITELDYTNAVTQGQNHIGPAYATLTYSSTTGLLTGVNDIANGASIDTLAYTYDPLARISTFTSIDGTAAYGYDHTSQLVSATYTTASGGDQPGNVSFTWNANGNNAAAGNVVSPNNEVTNDGTFTYQFDADGNRTSRTRISMARSRRLHAKAHHHACAELADQSTPRRLRAPLSRPLQVVSDRKRRTLLSGCPIRRAQPAPSQNGPPAPRTGAMAVCGGAFRAWPDRGGF